MTSSLSRMFVECFGMHPPEAMCETVELMSERTGFDSNEIEPRANVKDCIARVRSQDLSEANAKLELLGWKCAAS